MNRFIGFYLVFLLGFIGNLPSASAIEPLAFKPILQRMVQAYQDGRVTGTAYFGDTSADVDAYYLMAYAWGGMDGIETSTEAQRLYEKLEKQAIWKGQCVGWGIGTSLDAFNDGTINPPDTIYLYTSSRVLLALLAAEERGLIKVDPSIWKGADCSLETLFGFDPRVPALHYTDNRNDDKYLIYNVFADMTRVAFKLGKRLNSSHLIQMAKNSCQVLSDNTEKSGFLPYFVGKTDTDPTHHAMVVNGLFDCQQFFGIGESSLHRATVFMVENFIGEDGRKLAEISQAPEWAAGEMLVALSRMCRVYREGCEALLDTLMYVQTREHGGLVGNNNKRFQSWLAAGLAYAVYSSKD